MAKYETHVVGAARHTEWWIPAEELDALNDNIVGQIKVIHEFYPTDFKETKTSSD